MKRHAQRVFAVVLFLGFCCLIVSGSAQADTFGSGANAFDIEFVTIGDPNNDPDSTGSPSLAGAVPYTYRMGKYEISEAMVNAANAQSLADSQALNITIDSRGPNKPATSVSWFEAAQFVNWLNTSEGNSPAYKFDDLGEFQVWEVADAGFDADNMFRNKLAKYVLPSSDEWYKAAYYDPAGDVYFDYPTGSDDVPDGIDFVGDLDFEAVFQDLPANAGPNDISNVGLQSPYGTAGQGGNVSEWQESAFDLENDSPGTLRSDRGGAWTFIFSGLLASNSGIGVSPQFDGDFSGFRVAYIPEPSSVLLLGTGLLGFWRSSRRQGFRARS